MHSSWGALKGGTPRYLKGITPSVKPRARLISRLADEHGTEIDFRFVCIDLLAREIAIVSKNFLKLSAIRSCSRTEHKYIVCIKQVCR